MPGKIKVVWILCCVCIFVGFVYYSAKIDKQEHEAKNLELAEKSKQRAADQKKRQEMKAQFAEVMGSVKELNVLGKHEEAIAKASQAAKLDPKSAEALSWWGLSLAKAGKFKDAYEKFDQSSRLDPNQTRNYFRWGVTLMAEGEHEKAIEKFENALLLDPENNKAYASLGTALNNLGKYDEAIKKLEEALTQNSLNRRAYGVLVDAHFHKGQYQQAWQVVARARKNKITIAGGSLIRLSDASPEPR